MDDLKSMIAYSGKTFILIACVVAFLVFFLNILIGLANHTNKFSDTIEDKLSMVFYIDETSSQSEDEVYVQVHRLQQQLDSLWIENNFVTKTDAKAYFSQKIPDLMTKFDDYDISNPFPPTLHINIHGEQEYNLLLNILPAYSTILSNLDEELQSERNLQSQEKRILKAMNFSNFLVYGSYFLIVLFLVIIGFIFFSWMRVLVGHFSHKITIKKLLWATYLQVSAPFQAISFATLLVWFLGMFVLLLFLDLYLQQRNFSMMFFVDVFSIDIIPKHISWFILHSWYIIFAELIVILGMIYLLNHRLLYKKFRKAW